MENLVKKDLQEFYWDKQSLKRWVKQWGKLPAFGQIKEKEAKEILKQVLNSFTDNYFYAEAKARGDYLNMGEIIYDAQAGDPDATFLKALYDAVWAKEEELEKQLEEMTLDQLLELDLEAWAKKAYDQVKAELENQTENTESE